MWVPVALALAVILCYIAYKTTVRPPNFPTGPWNLPLVGYLPFLGRRPYVTLKELSKKYGDIYSIDLGGYRSIVLCSYELIKDALKEEAFAGRPLFPFVKFRSDNKGILFSQGNTWKEVRRFTLRHLRDLGLGRSSLERPIQEEVAELVESFKKDVGMSINLNKTFNLAVLNAVWTMTTGERFDLSDPKGLTLVNELNRTLRQGDTARASDLIPGMYRLRGYSPETRQAMSNNRIAIRDIINEHKRVHKEGDTSDFMHVFLNRMEEDEKQGISSPFTGEDGSNFTLFPARRREFTNSWTWKVTNLVVSTVDLFIAGSETISTTLLWLFWLLCSHPDVQDKVHQELDTIVGKERLPSNDDKPSLPYTEAVLMECQRYASLVPLSIMHCCAEDTKFKGYDIPKGTVIIPNLYQVLRDPRYWEKPDEFYPEHFLTQDGKVKRVEQLIPFSSGKRLCLGEGLAKLELFLFATSLLQQFKFLLSDDQPKPSSHPPLAIILAPKPYNVVMKLRI